MKRKNLLIVALAALMIGGWYAYSEYTRGPRDLNSEKAELVMTATELLTAFQSDETAANEKFLDKVISIKGTISSIEIGSPSTIILDTGDMMSMVSCEMADENLPKNLEEGKTLKIKGQCTGFLSDVILVKCVIE